ncbi:dienelactone hydrolase family protein [Bradyrhizobium liaoningense]|uniref:dienelactone hydrolase family protein n=1 Tax=Bradyrhizobium liaoningense TaxID=43992 RepID=UPI001BABBA53|nr:dienelactone hydrolase family protein [Bradyrhizobium liaoningense]MBR0858089.1 dienelactone hydrolase family protein [Bradyrhizobium liaoningense]
MAGQWIDIAANDGGSFKGYLAVPASGSGPGILLLQEIFGVNKSMRDVADYYAEEGYVVLAPDLFWRMEPGVELGYTEADFGKAMGYYQRFDANRSIKDAADALKVLRARPECQGGVGALGFCLGGKLAYLVAARTDVDCAVSYYGVGIEADLAEAGNAKCPMVFHFAELDRFAPADAREQIKAAFKARSDVEFYLYPGCDHAFAAPERASFDKPATLMAHSRSIALFRKVLGPSFDLSTLWDRHTELEFVTRSAEQTMTTMVAEPYVNHIPTMTGGVGYRDLLRFYKHHFIPKTPQDTKLVPISRTIGADRVVDEMLFCFTHDVEIDWMLPGVPPTGRYVEIPLVAIVRFRGDKLYNEHIYWDQASVLAQIGLLDPETLPIAGIETAKKLVDESLPSNTLMRRWSESAGK